MFQIYLAIFGLFALISLNSEFTQNKLKNIGIKVIYNIIYFYSACQIKCTQTYNYLLPYFKSDEIINKINMEQFNIDTNELLNISKYILDIAYKFDNKLFIVSKSDNDSITNKLIVDKNNICISFDESKITFIALYLNYNGFRYNINLKTDEFNYYLVGNVIDKHFVQYYINTVLNIKFSYTESEIMTYNLELMDHNVNMISLNFEQSIIIDKDGYRIINNGDKEEDDNKGTKELVKELANDSEKELIEEKVN